MIKDIRPTTDGGFICGGVVYTAAPDTGTQDMWVFKIDSNGCVDTSNCWVNPVGIPAHALLKNEAIKIYPNPARSTITVELPFFNGNSNRTFLLFNITGKQVLTQTLSSSFTQIDISQFPKGIYLYHIEINGVVVTNKLVKTN